MTKTTERKRRNSFDREHGVEIARDLFHARGFDAVGVAELTQVLGIVPPSLYAAYGSKLALFERALESYAVNKAFPLEQVLSSDKPPSEVLTDLFVAAAEHCTHDPILRGCMVTEAMRADDKKASAIATALAEKWGAAIKAYIAKFVSPEDADRITDYVLLTLRGLSSYACLGHAQTKLVGCAKVAGRALEAEFKLV